jgi:hypothetical protein
MKTHTRRFIIYLAITGVFPVLLLYPSLIYWDLAGMGGYDGFASSTMMEQHGVWSATDEHPVVYYIFNGCFLLWCLSLVNLPIACGVVVRRIQTSRQRA